MNKSIIAAGLVAFNAEAGINSFNNLKAPFSVTPLPYPSSSLSVVIDEATMKLHHDKHHQAYVDKLNKAVKAEKIKKTLLEIFQSASSQTDAVKNNAGGHWNHAFFWTVLSGKPSDNKMTTTIKQAIDKQFGSFDQFKTAFVEAGLGVFGSGWVWLIINEKGFLEITTTPNQDNPLMNTSKHPGHPILTVDVWEHAYYLKYQNDRKSYLEAIWKVVNWKQVNLYFKEFKK